jgi:Mn-dependent DtxR family transcriptional regulator
MKALRSCEEMYGLPYEEAYAETQRLEALIEEKDMWAMQTIVKYYQKLWT